MQSGLIHITKFLCNRCRSWRWAYWKMRASARAAGPALKRSNRHLPGDHLLVYSHITPFTLQ